MAAGLKTNTRKSPGTRLWINLRKSGYLKEDNRFLRFIHALILRDTDQLPASHTSENQAILC
jgi:hypothetical protein